MLKLIPLILVFSIVHLARSTAEAIEDSSVTHNSTFSNRVTRQSSTQPNRLCNSSNEGLTDYNPATSSSIWICKSSQWTSYLLTPSIGSTKHLSGQSCKEIQDHLSTDCHHPPKSAVYWVQNMEVYCEMNNNLNGGGWTLVWQHSYMEDLPLTTNMRFFSHYYRACTQHATSWCNIPKKARFNPTEQMIVAYHNKQVVYAYKGEFNRNIDYDWTGAILMVHTKITDLCKSNNDVHPNPVNVWIPGIAFNKLSVYNYFGGDATIKGSISNPSDHRWHGCELPSSISSTARNIQMTMAIYVR